MKLKYSIRTLLVLMILVAIGLRLKSHMDYLHWRSFIPVSYKLEAYWESEPPPQVFVKFGKREVSALVKRKAEAQKIEDAKNRKPNSEIYNFPERYVHYHPITLKERFPDWTELPDHLVQKLEDPSHDLERQTNFARIAITLGNREAFDWVLKSAREEYSDGSVLVALDHAPREWVETEELWGLFVQHKQFENSASSDNLFRIATKLFPEKAYQYLEQRLVDGKFAVNEDIEDAAYTVARYRPTLRALQASESLFPEQKPDDYDWDNSYSLASILGLYLDNDNPEIRKLALNYAQRMVNSEHWASQNFLELIVAHADPSWEPFFRMQCKSKHWQNYALNGLVACWDEPLKNQKLWELIVDETGFADAEIKRLARYKLTERLNGTKDPKLTKHLRKLYQDNKRSSAISLLYKLGHRPIELLRGSNENLADGIKLLELLKLLRANGLAQEITEEQINQQAMEFQGYPHKDFVRIDDQIRAALELAGLWHNIYCIDSVDYQLAELSKLSRGKMQLNSIHLNHDTSQLEFEFNQRVFQIDLESTDEYFDVYQLAEILNAILERDEIEERFIPHETDGSKESYFFFGQPEMAKTLRDSFEIRFQKACNEFLDQLSEEQ